MGNSVPPSLDCHQYILVCFFTSQGCSTEHKRTPTVDKVLKGEDKFGTVPSRHLPNLGVFRDQRLIDYSRGPSARTEHTLRVFAVGDVHIIVCAIFHIDHAIIRCGISFEGAWIDKTPHRYRILREELPTMYLGSHDLSLGFAAVGFGL